MSALAKTLAAAVVGAVVAAACSPPNIATSSGPAACADYAYAYCTKLASCSQTVFQLRYPDEKTCEKLIGGACTNNVAAKGTGVTASFEETCSTAVAKWSCVDFLDNIANPPPECVFPTGTRPDGQPCGLASQCQSGYCAIPIGAACGTCGTPPKPGDSCANLTTCGRGMACESPTCVAYSLLGGACSPAPCAAGLACSNGTCEQPTETRGMACSGTDGLLCDFTNGLSCNTLTLVCDSVAFVGYGEPCGTINGTRYYCSAGASCTNGVCDFVSDVGGACDLVAGPDCFNGTHCIMSGDGGTSGVCAFPDASVCP